MATRTANLATVQIGSGRAAGEVALPILLAISLSHCLNDTIQSVIPAIYPLLKASYGLDFVHVGLITLAFQLTASLLQPGVGLLTDRHPQPFSLPVGMGFTFTGLILLSQAGSFPVLLLAAALVGMGSSVFHPEASRVARLASGGRYGLAQSVFQVGGNLGSSLGPLLAAFLVIPHGQGSISWVSLVAILGILVLSQVGLWYRRHLASRRGGHARAVDRPLLPAPQVRMALAILVALMFSKFFYLTSLSSYYTFYLMDRFAIDAQQAQFRLFVFLAAGALGTIVGGPIGDRFGRKYVIWFSILGALPFTLALPHVGLVWTSVLAAIIGFILSSAFSAIVVYAQELVPGRVGMISGIFFGFAFGLGGIGAALLGALADATSIRTVYNLCAFLPMLGLLTLFLPDLDRLRRASA